MPINQLYRPDLLTIVITMGADMCLISPEFTGPRISAVSADCRTASHLSAIRELEAIRDTVSAAERALRQLIIPDASSFSPNWRKFFLVEDCWGEKIPADLTGCPPHISRETPLFVIWVKKCYQKYQKLEVRYARGAVRPL